MKDKMWMESSQKACESAAADLALPPPPPPPTPPPRFYPLIFI